ncbi:uncharacterized protein LOC111051266 isoform X3 [Nilaparvata lugens]|uniref:uncharacterized protein LOC111051266 isoform X3 n=1 Tax=Nilaparvata lugens TaxID=108931 RepID=UPI00193DA26D|nr:uncharacterized protein LOC111051266 isoform X3 [Nilaparvata lugens]
MDPSLKVNCIKDCCEDVSFQGVWDWVIKFNDPFTLHKAQPTYLFSQASFIFGAVATLSHDPCFLYQAMAAAANMRLSWWAEPWAVGAIVVLIDMPYDIASVKFVHWTWHDTDPNIGDRHYWVPWNSYFFHCTFAASFIFWFNRSMGHVAMHDKWSANSFMIEVKRMLVASLLGAPGGVLVFILIYHPLHDIAGIHTEVTFFIMFSIVMLIIWTNDRCPKSGNPPVLRSRTIIVVALLVHYLVFLSMVIVGNPENEVSTGLHEPTGPCNETAPLQTALGMVLEKKKYLCVDDYDEGYFDFSCTGTGPPEGIKRWYTICGTAFANRAEYISIIATISTVAAGFFYSVHFNVNSVSDDLKIKKIS